MNIVSSLGRGVTRRVFQPRRPLALAFGLVLVLCFSGCGGSGSPNTPTPVTPVVNFVGTWSGQYTISACGHVGDWPPCHDFFEGSVAPMTLTLSQTGSSVSGTLTQGNLITSVTGSVSNDNHLVLSGSTTTAAGGLPATYAIMGWDTQLNGNNMTGSWEEHITSPQISGFLQWIDTTNTVVKAAAAQSLERHNQAKGTLEDLLGLTKPGGN